VRELKKRVEELERKQNVHSNSTTQS
jgi:hypothetical protein